MDANGYDGSWLLCRYAVCYLAEGFLRLILTGDLTMGVGVGADGDGDGGSDRGRYFAMLKNSR